MALRNALGAIVLLAAACASDPVDLGITAGSSLSTTTVTVVQTTVPSSAPLLTIDPWNGHHMALSWTFDDGDPSHLRTVVPLLETAGIPGTFYPTCSEIAPDLDAWIAVADAGVHEIANHTVNHIEADGGDDTTEMADCDAYLADTVGVDVATSAYPADVVDEPYISFGADRYVASRAGWAFVTIVRSSTAPDWTAVPSVFVGDLEEAPDDQQVLDWPFQAVTDTASEAGWLTLTFHSVGTGLGFGPVSTAELEQMIEHAGQYDVWHATFADVASYHRGRLSLMNTLPVATESGGWIWQWDVAAGMTDVVLLVSVGEGELHQRGQVVPKDFGGRFKVDAILGEVEWRP